MKFDFLFKNKPEGKTPEAEKNDEMKEKVMEGTKADGMLDMVIAFDTTGSMSAYIGAVRTEVFPCLRYWISPLYGAYPSNAVFMIPFPFVSVRKSPR